MIIGGLVVSLKFKSVQTWAAQKAANYLSKELHTKVEVKSLYIKPFKSLVLEGFLIEDLQKDTLLITPKLIVDINYFSPLKERKISLNNIELDNGKFYLKRLKDSSSNLAFIINYFNSGVKDTTKRKPFDLNFDKVIIRNFTFKYKDFLAKDTILPLVNFKDVLVQHLNINLQNLDVKNYLFKANILHLSLQEKSGFKLNSLVAETTIDTNSIVLNKLLLVTPQSIIRNFFSMKFKSFEDFDDFENNVKLESNFINAQLNSKDISFFTSSLKGVFFDFGLDGHIKGKVNSLKAKKLEVKAGKSTYVKGDFYVKGLPDLQNTFMELKINQISTDKKDVEYIFQGFNGGKRGNIPAIVQKFGSINFKGEFTGFYNDFIAFGEFKTKLGRIKSDVNFKLSKSGYPSYSGTVETFDFNIGNLLDENSFGRTTFKADIIGKGAIVKELTEDLNAKIAYIDFNKYRYRNVLLLGKFDKQLFNGMVKVNDKNLNLKFNGEVNLNPSLPAFNFTSTIRKANLRALGFIKDSLSFDADFTTNFTGNNLDNIQGKLLLNHIKISNPKNSYSVDSVFLYAKGIGNNRLLALKSDIGDASITGQYDLATLPSSFKLVVKKYIPSWQTKIVHPKRQNFKFSIDVKNLDALTTLFMPELSLPERGTFTGRFNSDSSLVSVNGYVKKIIYDKIVYENLIIDQNNNEKSLEAIVSLDKVNLTDSVFIKNIILQNSLKNDSLTFNVKLSDKTSINQLDLYGLVEFGRDTSAKLSLLPSDIIIDNQVWKLQDKSRIRFDNNVTKIEGFSLFNNSQNIAINGSISKNINDTLRVQMVDVNLKSLSQLTRGWGINLSGTMNGDINLAAILAQPDIKSNVDIENLQYNKTFVGDLKLASAYNQVTRKIDVSAVVNNQGLKTMDINGNVNLISETDNLDLNVYLDKTEAIIFDPFVNDIVSNLTGQISSDIKVTGSFKTPNINGRAFLHNTGLTVNYLNTSYKINDEVKIDNSLLRINDLKIKDEYNHFAYVNGTVDLNNVITPDIQINISASNFLALNTTAKNNSLYYGTAFATGDFNFNGPVDAMYMNIKAKTESGTSFTIPLNGASQVGTNDFIYYVSKNNAKVEDENSDFLKGLTMQFELSVNEASTVNILTPVGNLTGSGDAELRLLITSLGDFEMYGDYQINTGKFDFTANNVINKTFDIKRGGDIRWTGNPSNAVINLNATYATRTTLAPLYLAAGQTQTDDRRNETVLAEANMLLTGSLLSPDIKFQLDFPNNTDIKTRLGGYLNNKDNENQQVINLVVRNSFSGSASGGIGFENSDLLGSGLELAFSKINNIISQSLKIKNLDINVRSYNELGGSYRFLNNRFTFRGNFYNNRYSSEGGLANNNLFNIPINDVTRDLEINYNINKDGTFIAKGFQRPSNRDFFNLNRDIYINGLGLVYTQEYDTFGEFLRNTFKVNSKNKDAKTEAKNTVKPNLK